MTNGIYILLGSNLGDKKKNLNSALKMINWHLGDIINTSKLYETAAWGKNDQPSFYNQVVVIQSLLAPLEMLNIIHQIEHTMGRVRKEKWGERIIDIDILYYGNQIIESDRLHVPHPGIPKRRFTLVPLVEVCPKLVHPILKKNHEELLKICPDQLEVKGIE